MHLSSFFPSVCPSSRPMGRCSSQNVLHFGSLLPSKLLLKAWSDTAHSKPNHRQGSTKHIPGMIYQSDPSLRHHQIILSSVWGLTEMSPERSSSSLIMKLKQLQSATLVSRGTSCGASSFFAFQYLRTDHFNILWKCFSSVGTHGKGSSQATSTMGHLATNTSLLPQVEKHAAPSWF